MVINWNSFLHLCAALKHLIGQQTWDVRQLGWCTTTFGCKYNICQNKPLKKSCKQRQFVKEHAEIDMHTNRTIAVANTILLRNTTHSRRPWHQKWVQEINMLLSSGCVSKITALQNHPQNLYLHISQLLSKLASTYEPQTEPQMYEWLLIWLEPVVDILPF